MNGTTVAEAVAMSNAANSPQRFRVLVEKSKRNGWSAETCIPIGSNPGVDVGASIGDDKTGQRIMYVTTSKASRGGLRTSALVQTSYPNGMTSFIMFGDFSTTIIESPERCTEKTVKAQHNAALQTIDMTLARANAFYEAKDIKDAAARKREAEYKASREAQAA